jgi:hypothetical protein
VVGKEDGVNDIKCSWCGKSLTNGLDTFGDVGEEFCKECFDQLSAKEDYGYGFPPRGVDPRDFMPDFELCSREEIKAWEEDKARAEAGEAIVSPPPGGWNNTHTIHVLAPRWGIGAYKIKDDAD